MLDYVRDALLADFGLVVAKQVETSVLVGETGVGPESGARKFDTRKWKSFGSSR